MTSIRTYVTILVQDLRDWLRRELRRWLIADAVRRISNLEVAPNFGLEALDRIAAQEKQLGSNLASIATAFARDNERLCALEDNAQTAKATAHGAALEFVDVKNRIEFLEKATVKVAKPAPKRKPAKR
jgi:hypothetical protein